MCVSVVSCEVGKSCVDCGVLIVGEVAPESIVAVVGACVGGAE